VPLTYLDLIIRTYGTNLDASESQVSSEAFKKKLEDYEKRKAGEKSADEAKLAKTIAYGMSKGEQAMDCIQATVGLKSECLH